MPVCPHCHQKIDHLDNWTKVWARYPMRVVEGEPLYGVGEIGEGVEPPDQEWRCPRCGKEIAFAEEDAVAFLTQNRG